MDKPSIAYMPRPDSTPRTERDALAYVLRFILDSHAKKMAARPAPEPDGYDRTKSEEDSAYARIIPKDS